MRDRDDLILIVGILFTPSNFFIFQRNVSSRTFCPVFISVYIQNPKDDQDILVFAEDHRCA